MNAFANLAGGAKESNESNAAEAKAEADATVTQLVEEVVEEVADDKVRYSSHPILNFRFGRYQFTNGLLELSKSDAELFDVQMAGASIRDQQLVKKLDVAAAEALAKDFLKGNRVRGIDTTENTLEA